MSDIQRFIDSINKANTICVTTNNKDMDCETSIFTINNATNDGVIDYNGMVRLQFDGGNTIMWFDNWRQLNVIHDVDEEDAFETFEFAFNDVKKIFYILN